MTALENIIRGIEKLNISGNKKNEYMLELLYVRDNYPVIVQELDVYTSYYRPADNLTNFLYWDATPKGHTYWDTLHKKLLNL